MQNTMRGAGHSAPERYVLEGISRVEAIPVQGKGSSGSRSARLVVRLQDPGPMSRAQGSRVVVFARRGT